MVEEATEANLICRILEGVSGGYYPNAYFLYEKLPKAFKERFSYGDVLTLFNKLEWNVKVIEIEHIRDTSAWNPWKGEPSVSKKVIEYRVRPQFEGWKHKPGLFEKILQNLHQELPQKIDFDLTLE
ncbi:MAG: hypothetical protein H8D32_05770 [Dehalococcoidia bacterium]|nr:hypothetical protein [Dehalococcoidia bacterium]